MYRVLTCLTFEHDWRLVLLGWVICTLASAVTIRFSAVAWSEMSPLFATALPPASAIAATVSIGYTGTELRIEVADTGRGMTGTESTGTESTGIESTCIESTATPASCSMTTS